MSSRKQSASIRISPLDLRLKVIAIVLEPALALARVLALPLDDLQRLVATGYFCEARTYGLSFRQIARRFDKSLRTVTNLARSSSADLPLRGGLRITLRRRAAELVAKQRGRMPIAKLLKEFPNVDQQVLLEEAGGLVSKAILWSEE